LHPIIKSIHVPAAGSLLYGENGIIVSEVLDQKALKIYRLTESYQ
jgi:hypothetical protein